MEGKFDELHLYLVSIGASSSSDLEECTIDLHEIISSHLKILKKNKYLKLVS